MLYEKCAEVNEDFWQELALLPPAEVTRRTGAAWDQDHYRLPFLNRLLKVDPCRRQVRVAGAETSDPGFRLCLTVLLYLARVNVADLGSSVSPLELSGGPTFFQNQGPHALPSAPLEERFGRDPESFMAAGRCLGGEPRAAGDAALGFRLFPGLTVEAILWAADEEFPAQASFTVPAGLDRFWHLDAILGLLQLLVRELLAEAG